MYARNFLFECRKLWYFHFYSAYIPFSGQLTHNRTIFVSEWDLNSVFFHYYWCWSQTTRYLPTSSVLLRVKCVLFFWKRKIKVTQWWAYAVLTAMRCWIENVSVSFFFPLKCSFTTCETNWKNVITKHQFNDYGFHLWCSFSHYLQNIRCRNIANSHVLDDGLIKMWMKFNVRGELSYCRTIGYSLCRKNDWVSIEIRIFVFVSPVRTKKKDIIQSIEHWS